MSKTVLVVTTNKELLSASYKAAVKLDMKILPLAETSSHEFLAQPWHAVIVDAAMPDIDSVSLLSLVRSLSPFALRGLVVSFQNLSCFSVPSMRLESTMFGSSQCRRKS
jgi:DNA-binding NarL/FixJ family response regulator